VVVYSRRLSGDVDVVSIVRILVISTTFFVIIEKLVSGGNRTHVFTEEDYRYTVFCLTTRTRRFYSCNISEAYSMEGFGGHPLFGKFFQFTRVFKQKIPNPPLNFPVFTKKFKTPPSKNFWIRFCLDAIKLHLLELLKAFRKKFLIYDKLSGV